MQKCAVAVVMEFALPSKRRLLHSSSSAPPTHADLTMPLGSTACASIGRFCSIHYPETLVVHSTLAPRSRLAFEIPMSVIGLFGVDLKNLHKRLR